MILSRYANPNGGRPRYVYNGCEYDEAQNLILTGMLGFCGCGRPEDAAVYVRDVLQHIENLKQLVWADKTSYTQWAEAGKLIFTTTGAEYFAYYVLTEKDFLEHGGSVPGWLTEKGKQLLADLNELIPTLDLT